MSLIISFGYTSYELQFCNKTCTRRAWKERHAQKFIKAYHSRSPIKAYDKACRYGGQQVGWLELTAEPCQERLALMPEEDVAKEGFPDLSKSQFIDRFFSKYDLSTLLWVIRFKYSPLEKCLQQHTFLPEAVATQKARSRQDTPPSGQLKMTSTPQPSTENASLMPVSLKPTSTPYQPSLFDSSQYQTSLSGGALALISALLGKEPESWAIADNCFLRASDFWKLSSLSFFSLRMSKDYSQVTAGKMQKKSSDTLQKWGMWGVGNCGTEIDMFPKVEKESSLWVFTGNIQITSPIPDRKELRACLRTNGIPIKARPDKGVWCVDEAPSLVAESWVYDLHIKRGTNGGGAGFGILDKVAFVNRAGESDRVYFDQAPCLRSLSVTNGHQGGNGASKIREWRGEDYVERSLLPEEAEALMGWEPNSTAVGIDSEGNEYQLTATQRHRILGNGIIPQEVTEILQPLKQILEMRPQSTNKIKPGNLKDKHFYCDLIDSAVQVINERLLTFDSDQFWRATGVLVSRWDTSQELLIDPTELEEIENFSETIG